MSKVVKGIKKGIKKVGKVVKKVAPYALMATAAYFTGGVALSYFGPTQAFASNLPLFGGSGMFTKAASFMGLNGPTAAAQAGMANMGVNAAGVPNALAAVGGSGSAGATTGSLASLGGPAASGYSAAAGGAATGSTAAGVGTATQQAGKGMLKEAGSQTLKETAKAGMGVADKLLIAKTVTDVASGLFADKPRDPNKYSWGYNRKGEGMDIIQHDREIPSIQRQTPEDFYRRGTPEFMPAEKPRGQTASQDRSSAQYQQRHKQTAPSGQNDEEFI